MRKRAYSSSRAMTWERTAERYMSVFENAGRRHRLKTIARTDTGTLLRDSRAPPEMQLGHFLSMCDDTGLFQHAVHSVPDRAHGYCVDDNARALLVACALNNPGEERLPEALTARFAAFVQHAWNPDTRRFRNFMGFNRCWLEDRGSEDSHGRTLWALGVCALTDASPVAALMGRGAVFRSDGDSGRFSFAPCVGVRIVGPRCLLLGCSGRFPGDPPACRACRSVDFDLRYRGNRRLGLVRGRVGLR
ncbi:hypothetical protein ACVWWG_000648 [Bradyrhizobium sp. LB7.2]